MEKEKLTPQQKADKKWAEKNRERRTYLSKRSTARSFINKNATEEDLLELEKLIKINLKKVDKTETAENAHDGYNKKRVDGIASKLTELAEEIQKNK